MIATEDTAKPHHTHNPFMIAALKKQIVPLVGIFNGELFNIFPQFRNELRIPTISLLFSILQEVLASLKDKK